MAENVEATITALKERFSAENDADLARRLRISKSTISSWRARNSVPQRFLGLLDGESHQFVLAPPLKWGDHEEAAFRVALFRFSRLMQKTMDLNDYRKALGLFASEASSLFWLMMADAQKDLMHRQGDHSLATALALLLHDDVTHHDATVQRDQKRIGDVLREGQPWTPRRKYDDL